MGDDHVEVVDVLVFFQEGVFEQLGGGGTVGGVWVEAEFNEGASLLL